jgi:hypothetical protein
MAILKKFSNWLYKVSTGWVALAGLIVFLLFTSLVLPAQSAGAGENRGDAGSPDMSFIYSPQELYKMAEAYGEQGRMAYIQARFTFDLIWPLVYALFLSTAISWVFARAFSPRSLWRWANLAPILGLVFDYAENISTSLVMYRYPAQTNLMAAIAPLLTPIKWIFVGGSFGLLFIGIFVLVWRAIQRRIANVD